jgi:ribosomal protein S18 acetylase RimI-like enzyme
VTDTSDSAGVLGRPGQAYEAARLRWATRADLPRLAALWTLAYPEDEVTADELRRWLERGGALLMHDRSGDLLAALPWREVEGGWEIQRVATLPRERGQGYGRWLMTKVEAAAIKANVPTLRLTLPSDGDGEEQLSYYERMGYAIEGEAETSGWVHLRKRVGGVWQTKAVGA